MTVANDPALMLQLPEKAAIGTSTIRGKPSPTPSAGGTGGAVVVRAAEVSSIDVESGNSHRPSLRHVVVGGVAGGKAPTHKFTAHQLFYLFVLDGIGAAILSGGINFAIAYGLYAREGGPDRPIRLFQFPNTLAGDAGLTIIIQSLVTWHIELLLVNRDLRKGGVHPIGFVPEPPSTNFWWRQLRWFMFLDREKERPAHETGVLKHWFGFLCSQIMRSLVVAAVFFPFIWAPSIGFLTLAGEYREGDWYYSALWAPQVYKLVEGAVLGLLSTPLMALFWLTRCGWALKNNEVNYGQR